MVTPHMVTTFISDGLEDRHIDRERYLEAIEYVRDDGRLKRRPPER